MFGGRLTEGRARPQSTAGSTTVGFAIFIVGWIFNTVVGGFGFPFSANVFYGNNGELYYALFLLLPWNAFSKGMRDLGRATPTPDSPGLAWSERDSYCRNPRRDGAPLFDPDRYINNNCVLSLGEVYGYLACLWLGYFVLAIYFDQVIADKNGVKRSPLFFLNPNYWRGGVPSLRFLPADGAEDGAPPAHVVGDEDVEAEWRKMQARLRQVRQAGALPEDLDGKFALQVRVPPASLSPTRPGPLHLLLPAAGGGANTPATTVTTPRRRSSTACRSSSAHPCGCGATSGASAR